MNFEKAPFKMFHESFIPECTKSSIPLCSDLLLERKTFINRFVPSVFYLEVASTFKLPDMHKMLGNNSRLRECRKMYEFHFNVLSTSDGHQQLLSR